ncbi:hypothetical protein KW797_03615, partial [Candidatus Parcubacteria bacterium]|nr:hypothetical protein [Candidatus Parcubacteria bacterium]
TVALCHATNGQQSAPDEIVDCSGAPSDIAEWYDATEDVEAGDIVMPGGARLAFHYASGIGTVTDEKGSRYEEAPLPGATTTVAVLTRASLGGTPLGVVSQAPYQTFGEDVKKYAASPERVALVGRVPVKVSTEGGPIKSGDRIALSSIPGVGMRATTSGMTVGIALEDFDGTSPDETVYSTTTPQQVTVNGSLYMKGSILLFVNLSYVPLNDTLAAATSTEAVAAAATNAWSIDQQNGLVNVNFFGDINLQGHKLLDVSRIAGFGGKWSIDENGNFAGESLTVAGTVKLGSPERRTGITLYDEVTGEPYCLSLAAGATKTAAGECSGGVIGTAPSMTGTSTPETAATSTDPAPSESATSTPIAVETATSTPATP